MRIDGVRLIETIANRDHRGTLSTIFKESEAGPLRQWNYIDSHARALRGMHAHLAYDELYVPVRGRMFMVLKDARRGAPSFGSEIVFWTDDIQNKSLFVPRGVAHGVYFATTGALLYGLSRTWTGGREIVCRWDDPEIQAPWPDRDPVLSGKDSRGGSFAEMIRAVEQAGAPKGQ